MNTTFELGRVGQLDFRVLIEETSCSLKITRGKEDVTFAVFSPKDLEKCFSTQRAVLPATITGQAQVHFNAEAQQLEVLLDHWDCCWCATLKTSASWEEVLACGRRLREQLPAIQAALAAEEEVFEKDRTEKEIASLRERLSLLEAQRGLA